MPEDRRVPVDLRVDFCEAPLNVAGDPQFSWRVDDAGRGAAQTGYQILVASDREALADDRGDVWDSGTVESSRAVDVPYDGEPLGDDEVYHWKVRVWDEEGNPTPYSEPATFGTAPDVVDGDWISYQPGDGDANGYRSRWHPADEDATESVQIDLGESRDIDAVRLTPASPFEGVESPDGLTVSPMFARGVEEDDTSVHHPPGVYGFGFPESFRIDVAEDPTFERITGTVTRDDVTNPGSDPLTVDIGANGRYVRVTATELYTIDPADGQRKLEHVREEFDRWKVFALAGLSAIDADGDVVAGRSADASSSVETETWGCEYLTDGRGSTMASSSPLLRQELELSKPIERARVHVAGLGYGELYVNGEKVSDDVLNPAWTQFDDRVLYSTYDVTDALEAGANALGIWLGRGWFSKSFYDWTGFGSPRAILSLVVEYRDGTTRTLSSGPDWRANESPIVENDVYDGETYDARREQDGWAEPGFDDSDWATAAVVRGPGGDLRPQRVEAMQVVDTVDPDEITEHPDGPIVDFGQNLTGWIELTVDDPETDREVTVRHAEALTEDGELSTIDLRTADATDTYVARGDDRERYEPRFTYHGFRFAQIENYPGELTADNVSANVVHTAMEPTGEFACSNEELEAVQRASEWGLRGNSHAVPTDCPQRDERFGWTGDGRLTARAFQYNFDAVRFHEKWMHDHEDAQSPHGYVPDTIPYGFGTIPSDPCWSLTMTLVPWTLYEHYGDRSVLEEHFDAMRRYVDYWRSVDEDGILPGEYGNYGDWLSFENTHEEVDTIGQPFELFNTAAHYRSTELVAAAAGALGHEETADRYRERAASIADAFNDRFLDEETGRYEPKIQAAQAVPLFLDIVPDPLVDDVASTLASLVEDAGGQLRTGFLGTRALMDALTSHGHEDLAYEVVSQPEQPGWVYMIRNGATTIWERWDSDQSVGSGMNSLNHSPFTMASEWFYRGLAGVSPAIHDRHVEIDPAVVDELDWVESTVDTPLGPVNVEWERSETELELTVTVPWNARASLRLPDGYDRLLGDDTTVWTAETGSEERIPGVESVDGTTVSLTAGTFQFTLQ